VRCAKHPESEAMAICRACYRGVCRTCAIPAGRSVVCSPECGADAARLLRMVAVSGRNAPAVQRTQAVALLVLAALTAVAAVLSPSVGRWVFGFATAILLVGALRFFRLAAHWREVERGDPGQR
jgi:hypothetical protein